MILTAVLMGGGVCRGEAIPVWFTEMKDGSDPKSCPVEGDDPRIASPLPPRSPTDADPRTYAEQAQELYDYHAILLGLMEAELGNDPTDAQQAVYDAQARKVEEMARFREAAGIGARSTAIWAN